MITLAAGSLVIRVTAVGALGLTGLMPMTFTTNDAVIAGMTVPWLVPVILLGVLPTALAYTLGIAGVARLRPSFASLVGLSEVLFAVLAAGSPARRTGRARPKPPGGIRGAAGPGAGQAGRPQPECRRGVAAGCRRFEHRLTPASPVTYRCEVLRSTRGRHPVDRVHSRPTARPRGAGACLQPWAAHAEVVFARGTSEDPGTGQVGQAFVDELRSRAGDRSVGAYAVNYPASPDFLAAADGANDASAFIQNVAVNCPATRLVLGGYSQGAAIVDVLASVPFPVIGFTQSAADRGGQPSPRSVPNPPPRFIADNQLADGPRTTCATPATCARQATACPPTAAMGRTARPPSGGLRRGATRTSKPISAAGPTT